MLEKDIVKYSSKIYRKLYVYALLVMITSIVLTITVLAIFFKHDERHFFDDHTINHAMGVKNILTNLVSLKDKSVFMANKKVLISERPEQYVEYVSDIESLKKRNDISSNNISNILNTGKPELISKNDNNTSRVVMFLDEKDQEKGLIIYEVKRGRPKPEDRGSNKPPKKPFERPDPMLITGLSILTFLSLLLIPFSRYIFKPFQQLMLSINRVATGDFKAIVNVSKNSDFKGIADSFNNMTMKIHDMIHQRDRLIADVSHELRTPLTRMRLALELLDKEGKGKQKYIDKSISEIEHLDKLIDDLLDASKLELNKNDFLFEKVDLKKNIYENIEKNSLIFSENNLKINSQFTDRDCFVKIESQLFERALSNIFSNLVKYAPYDSQVDISLNIENKEAVITVRDRGEGVKDDEYEKIFEPFYRTDTSRSRKTGGTGLGLSIVKQIISLHDGSIKAHKPIDNQSGLSIEIRLKIVD